MLLSSASLFCWHGDGLVCDADLLMNILLSVTCFTWTILVGGNAECAERQVVSRLNFVKFLCSSLTPAECHMTAYSLWVHCFKIFVRLHGFWRHRVYELCKAFGRACLETDTGNLLLWSPKLRKNKISKDLHNSVACFLGLLVIWL